MVVEHPLVVAVIAMAVPTPISEKVKVPSLLLLTNAAGTEVGKAVALEDTVT
jgi:hypothetical protein